MQALIALSLIFIIYGIVKIILALQLYKRSRMVFDLRIQGRRAEHPVIEDRRIQVDGFRATL